MHEYAFVSVRIWKLYSALDKRIGLATALELKKELAGQAKAREKEMIASLSKVREECKTTIFYQTWSAYER